MAAPFRLQRDTAADNDSVVPLPRQSNGTDGARPQNGMHLRRKYGLLAPEEPEGGQANAGTLARGDGHGVTRGTVAEGRMEIDTGFETGQHALLAHCGMQEGGNEEKIPPD